MSDIVVIDNVIPLHYQKLIFDSVSSCSFPYYYAKASSTKDADQKLEELKDNPKCQFLIDPKNDIGMFSHKLIRDGEINSEYTEQILNPFQLFNERIQNGVSKTNLSVDLEKIIRMQVNLVTETKKWWFRHTPWHTDMEEDHIGMIYYIVDTDGKTLFKNRGSVTPKQGRCVIFNGKIKHCHQLSSSYRSVLNFNILW